MPHPLVSTTALMALASLGTSCASSVEDPNLLTPSHAASEAAQETDGIPSEPPRLPEVGCVRPAGCNDIRTDFFMVNACCTKEVACGVDASFAKVEWNETPKEVRDMLYPADFDPFKEPCIASGRLFRPFPSLLPEGRVKAERGKDILITSSCGSRALNGFLMPGCCLPNNECGLSNHWIISDLRILSDPGAEMRNTQCMSASEINRQLRDTRLALFADMPPLGGSCDYAALDARLPPPEEPGTDTNSSVED